MASSKKSKDDPMYELLQQENIMEFNSRRALGEGCDLRAAHLRGLDLRGLDATDLDMRDAYLRGADVRGVDFRRTKLEGASLADCNISGAYFPAELSAQEIMLSVNRGTRLRYETDSTES